MDLLALIVGQLVPSSIVSNVMMEIITNILMVSRLVIFQAVKLEYLVTSLTIVSFLNVHYTMVVYQVINFRLHFIKT